MFVCYRKTNFRMVARMCLQWRQLVRSLFGIMVLSGLGLQGLIRFFYLVVSCALTLRNYWLFSREDSMTGRASKRPPFTYPGFFEWALIASMNAAPEIYVTSITLVDPKFTYSRINESTTETVSGRRVWCLFYGWRVRTGARSWRP